MGTKIPSTRLDGSGDYILYIATFPNGKMYVGISKNSLDERRKQHYSAAKYSRKKGPMQRALAYYKDAVKWEVMHTKMCLDSARASEKRFISLWNTKAPNGYNATDGGDHYPKTRWDRASFRLKKAINKPFKVFQSSDMGEVGEWTCIAQAAEDLNVDASNISRCLTGKTVSHRGYIFCFVSEIENLNCRVSRAQTNRGRKFEVFDHSGNSIGIWDNSNKCARDLGLSNPRDIRAVLNQPNRTSYKNYKFRYI